MRSCKRKQRIKLKLFSELLCWLKNFQHVFLVFHRGSRCEIEVDYCTPNPCRHNSTCSNVKDTAAFKCNCTKGYTGATCEIDIDECSSNPCLNGGLCIDLVSIFRRPDLFDQLRRIQCC